MLTTSLPSFQDGVHDAQKTFRTLLDALARPGRVEAIAVPINPPRGLMSACAAACLTLLDLETRVWLQPGLDAEVASWLVFHAGCRFTQKPQQSDFALIWDVAALPDLTIFSWGTAEYPEASTTLLIQTEQLSQGESLVLRGPGILHEQAIAPQLPVQFWQQWRTNYQSYPQGIDVFLFAQHDVMGLPRTAEIVGS